METAIERLFTLCCLVIGLSHIIQPRVWVELSIAWRAKAEVGIFYVALLHFPFGALIIAFHDVWRGIPLIVTLFGWGWTIKGLLYLIYPKLALRMLERVSLARAWEFVVAGVVLLAVGLLVGYSLASRGAL